MRPFSYRLPPNQSTPPPPPVCHRPAVITRPSTYASIQLSPASKPVRPPLPTIQTSCPPLHPPVLSASSDNLSHLPPLPVIARQTTTRLPPPATLLRLSSPGLRHPSTRLCSTQHASPTPQLPTVARKSSPCQVLANRLVITLRPYSPIKVQPPTLLIHPTVYPAHSPAHQLVLSILV